MKMAFGANMTPIEVIKKEYLEKLILEIFFLMLIINGMNFHGKNLMN